jgi:ABC-2 type transport system permease protein
VSLALHAEWTKLRTLAANGWLLLTAIAVTVALTAAAAAGTNYASTNPVEDTTKLSLTGIYVGQAIISIIAVTLICTEYSTGMITLTLAATPRRTVMLAAKASILVALTVAAGMIAVLGSLLAGRLILPGNGFTNTHGYPTLSLTHEPTLRAASGSVIYLTLIALLSLGVATAVRDSATAIGLVLGLLFLFPIINQVVTNPTWHRHLEQVGPMTAGLAIQNTTNIHHLPISPWHGLAVLAAWSAAALLTGGLLLRLRDA